jgi:hypothetical protein
MSRTPSHALADRSQALRLCVALVLAAGLTVVWAVALVWIVGIAAALTSRSGRFDQILFTADGTPMIGHHYFDGRRPEYFTVDGKKYEPSDSDPWLGGAAMAVDPPQEEWAIMKPVAPRMEAFTDGQPFPVDWFFVQFGEPRRIGFFVGYDRVSRRKVGYLGHSGFQSDEPAGAQAFEIDRALNRPWGSSGLIAPAGSVNGISPAQYTFQSFSPKPYPGRIPGEDLYLISGDRVLRINLRARTVETVLESRGSTYIAKFARTSGRQPAVAPEQNLEDALAMRGPGTITVLDATGRQDAVYRLPAELSDRPLQFYQLPDRTAVALDRRIDPEKHLETQNLIWFTKEGTITRRLDGVLSSGDWHTSPESAAMSVAFAIPALVGPIGAAIGYPLGPNYPGSARTYREAFADDLRAMWPAFVIGAVWSVLAVGLYFRRAAKFGEARRVAWIMFLILFGLPGYIGYMLSRRWPARVACLSCGALAPRDRDQCFRCAKELPAPAPNGLEVFA